MYSLSRPFMRAVAPTAVGTHVRTILIDSTAPEVSRTWLEPNGER